MNRDDYRPGPASDASIRPDGSRWMLVMVRQLHQPPTAAWQAITEPAQLHEWAPFDADHSLGTVGPVKLSTVGVPNPQASSTTVTRADAPKVLEYSWGGNAMHWELEPRGDGTQLTLRHSIDRDFVSMGAAGWHICLDVLERFLDGEPIGRIVAADAMKFDWQRLDAEYGARFGMKPPRGATKG